MKQASKIFIRSDFNELRTSLMQLESTEQTEKPPKYGTFH